MKLYDIIIKEKEQQSEKVIQDIHTSEEKENDTLIVSDVVPRKNRFKRFFYFFLAGAILVLLYVISIWFSYAKIVVYERSVPFTLENTMFELGHEDSQIQKDLTFQTVTVESSIFREVFGTEFKEVSEKAKGNVIFFNTWSKTKQTIPVKTTLEGSNGKRYQTTTSVTVPGYTEEGGEKKPGTSISVPIVAIDIGPASNASGLDFKVVSYVGAKKQGLTARSAGQVSGGQSGPRHTVSDTEKKVLLDTLQVQLAERLRRETRAQIPKEFFVSSDLQFLFIDPQSFVTEGESVKFIAEAQGTMVSYLIKREALYRAIANEIFRDESLENLYIPDLSALDIRITSAVPIHSKTIPDTITVSVSGNGIIRTKVDPIKVASLLVNQPTKSFRTIIASQKNIDTAELSLYPFWAPFFPKSKEFISVETR